MREVLGRLGAVVRPVFCVNALLEYGEISLMRETIIMMPTAIQLLSCVSSILVVVL